MTWKEERHAFTQTMFAEGHKFENIVADILRSHGLPVTVGKKVICEKYDDRHTVADEIDMKVHGKTTEVKSTRQPTFRNPLYMCSCTAWEHKKKVDIWIVIKQLTREMICCSGEAVRQHGQIMTTHDSRRGIPAYQLIALDLKHFMTVQQLVEMLVF